MKLIEIRTIKGRVIVPCSNGVDGGVVSFEFCERWMRCRFERSGVQSRIVNCRCRILSGVRKRLESDRRMIDGGMDGGDLRLACRKGGVAVVIW